MTIVARDGRWACAAPGPWHFSQPSVPLGHGFGFDVVVDGVAAVAERAGRALHVVVRVKGGPPVRPRGRLVGAPDLMAHVPLGAERIVIVAPLYEVALLPLAAVDQGDVVPSELH